MLGLCPLLFKVSFQKVNFCSHFKYLRRMLLSPNSGNILLAGKGFYAVFNCTNTIFI